MLLARCRGTHAASRRTDFGRSTENERARHVASLRQPLSAPIEVDKAGQLVVDGMQRSIYWMSRDALESELNVLMRQGASLTEVHLLSRHPALYFNALYYGQQQQQQQLGLKFARGGQRQNKLKIKENVGKSEQQSHRETVSVASVVTTLLEDAAGYSERVRNYNRQASAASQRASNELREGIAALDGRTRSRSTPQLKERTLKGRPLLTLEPGKGLFYCTTTILVDKQRYWAALQTDWENAGKQSANVECFWTGGLDYAKNRLHQSEMEGVCFLSPSPHRFQNVAQHVVGHYLDLGDLGRLSLVSHQLKNDMSEVMTPSVQRLFVRSAAGLGSHCSVNLCDEAAMVLVGDLIWELRSDEWLRGWSAPDMATASAYLHEQCGKGSFDDWTWQKALKLLCNEGVMEMQCFRQALFRAKGTYSLDDQLQTIAESIDWPFVDTPQCVKEKILLDALLCVVPTPASSKTWLPHATLVVTHSLSECVLDTWELAWGGGTQPVGVFFFDNIYCKGAPVLPTSYLLFVLCPYWAVDQYADWLRQQHRTLPSTLCHRLVVVCGDYEPPDVLTRPSAVTTIKMVPHPDATSHRVWPGHADDHVSTILPTLGSGQELRANPFFYCLSCALDERDEVPWEWCHGSVTAEPCGRWAHVNCFCFREWPRCEWKTEEGEMRFHFSCPTCSDAFFRSFT